MQPIVAHRSGIDNSDQGEHVEQPKYLDDFQPGQVFRSPGSLTVHSADIKAFAAQFDPQPFHLDEAAAQQTFFKGLAASGWHTAALTMRLLVDTLNIEGGLIGAGFDEFRWPRPTRPGDTLRLDAEVLGIKTSQSKPLQGFLHHRVTTYNQHDEPVLIMTGNLLVPRRSQG
ncbi:MaoC family dehydratase [Herbaspirillum seropedicae]|uniref:Acyl dehydratase protein n=1 Tax=Herbaspirillum seropedicae (strain SmR1) TaxID=757424 RepID=D8J1L6_HERSS|nr:MaoC family dehydratase [Herbaspirillum seropedicae]ADJ62637.1 acyl dehydratase protein [Herbaspirillum seropedicae SmR1]UMU20686.1 MaoC family dehydratase [Herbaspirillum seropedicae]